MTFKITDGTELHNYLVKKDYFVTGNLWGWGSNDASQLGNNEQFINKLSPVQTVAGGTNWKHVSCGQHNTGAIKADHSLWVCGYNGFGQLGITSVISTSSPVQVTGTAWKQVSYGFLHMLALRTDGTLWSCGYGGEGRLGNISVINKSSPAQIVGTMWNQISCGGSHSASIKTDGTLWTWGYNLVGQLGDGSTSNRSSPVQVAGTTWKQVSCGHYHTAAIKKDGTLFLWGQNPYGGLGDDTNSSKSSPVQTISQGANWKQVSCGYHLTAAIKTDGTLWCFGNNNYGRLGDDTRAHRSSPVQTISQGANWKQVSTGNYGMTAIKTDGTLWSWGYNSYGTLGDGTTAHRSSPVQTVRGGSNWKQVSSGVNHVSAIEEPL